MRLLWCFLRWWRSRRDRGVSLDHGVIGVGAGVSGDRGATGDDVFFVGVDVGVSEDHGVTADGGFAGAGGFVYVGVLFDGGVTAEACVCDDGVVGD